MLEKARECGAGPVRRKAVERFARLQRDELPAHDLLQRPRLALLAVGRLADGEVAVLVEFAALGLENAGHVRVVFDRVLFQGQQLHLVEEVIDRVLQGRCLADRARVFRLEDVEHQMRGHVFAATVIEEHAVESRCAKIIETDPVIRVVPISVADPMRFDELQAQRAVAVARLVDEVFAVHVHAAADERLAFGKAEAVADLTLSRPLREVFLGGLVPIGVARERLGLDAVAGGVDRHVADQLAHEAGILVEVARTADQFAPHAGQQIELGITRSRTGHASTARRGIG